VLPDKLAYKLTVSGVYIQFVACIPKFTTE
jgi:hypothetical protein